MSCFFMVVRMSFMLSSIFSTRLFMVSRTSVTFFTSHLKISTISCLQESSNPLTSVKDTVSVTLFDLVDLCDAMSKSTKRRGEKRATFQYKAVLNPCSSGRKSDTQPLRQRRHSNRSSDRILLNCQCGSQASS